MQLKLINFLGDINNKSDVSNMFVSDKIFGCSLNVSLIHQVVSSYLVNSRQGTRAQKSRSEVVGSKKKPWRQKGTGHARAGSSKSPIWRSGGVTFAAKTKKFHHKINKKMYRGAIKSILSKLVFDDRLFLIKNFFLDQPKTKLLLGKLENITLQKSNILIVTDFLNKNLLLASRNLYKIKICDFAHLDPVSLINFKITLLTDTVVNKIEKQLI